MSHETKGKSDEWYTPKYIFDALGCKFDLDVASPDDISKINVPASNFISSDSLIKNWDGFIWMNPPYGNMRVKFEWIEKFINHGNGIALMPDRTSAPWFQHFSNNSDCILFVNKKIKFIDEYGKLGESPSNGSCLFAIGQKGVEALMNAEKKYLGLVFKRKLS